METQVPTGENDCLRKMTAIPPIRPTPTHTVPYSIFPFFLVGKTHRGTFFSPWLRRHARKVVSFFFFSTRSSQLVFFSPSQTIQAEQKQPVPSCRSFSRYTIENSLSFQCNVLEYFPQLVRQLLEFNGSNQWFSAQLNYSGRTLFVQDKQLFFFCPKRSLKLISYLLQ